MNHQKLPLDLAYRLAKGLFILEATCGVLPQDVGFKLAALIGPGNPAVARWSPGLLIQTVRQRPAHSYNSTKMR